jgi:hypothetical protein
MSSVLDRKVAEVHAEEEIARRLAAERARWSVNAGLVQFQQQFKRPAERPFTAAERGTVTILIGGMTWKHDNMFRAVFEGCGYAPMIGQLLHWSEALNSDALLYGGSGRGNSGGIESVAFPLHGRPPSLNWTIPPLGVLVFRPEARDSF